MALNIKKEFGTSRNLQRKPDLATLVYGKVPPQAPEMEEAVLGACLLERETLNTVVSILPNADSFYVDSHQKIYTAMLDMWNRAYPVDLLTVTEELRRKNELELIGGAYYITKLTMSVLTSAHVEAHARTVLEKFYQRELIRISGSVISEAYEDSTDVFDLLDTAKKELEAITKDLQIGGDSPIGRIFLDVVKELEYQKNHKTALTGVDTGLYDLNEITNGWQKADLIILAARPSKGKTALALNLALSAAISTLVQHVPAGIFSLEMGAAQLVKRMASTVTGIDFGKIMSGNLTDGEFDKIAEKSRYFHMLPIHIADKVFTLQNIGAKARKWKEKHNVGILLIDYLQLIKAIRQQGGNREQEISGITRDLKMLAKELELPIILLSQLNRNVESRTSPEPTMSDLRESGAIEQDADVIIFPWHSNDGSFISVAKNRNGKVAVGTDALKIKFAGSIQKWMEPSAFEPFKEQYIPENARAGIINNYQKLKDSPDEEAPF